MSYDTVRFTQKVLYPYGKNFQCVAPSDTMAELFVANEIEKVINDSISRILVRTRLDYDKTSLYVRKATPLKNRFVSVPVVDLKLFGTASPEATKYGYEKSIQPGQLEQENIDLAQQRLNRTAAILKERGFDTSAENSIELQFSDGASLERALVDKSVLDNMRYVSADVTIAVEKLEVTTMTAPVLFPLWLGLLALGLVSLWNLRIPKWRRPSFSFRLEPWEWREIWDTIKYLLLGGVIGLVFLVIFMTIGVMAVLVTMGLIILFLLWFGRRLILSAFIAFYWWVRNLIYLIRRWTRVNAYLFRRWWRNRTTCQKVLFFLIPYAIGMTLLVIYLLLICPCW